MESCFDRRVSSAALATAALVLSSTNWKNTQGNIRGGGGNQSKKPWAGTFTCRRAGIDAALMRAQFFPQAHPTSKMKNEIEQTVQNSKVASAKVALDTVRLENLLCLTEQFCLQHILQAKAPRFSF